MAYSTTKIDENRTSNSITLPVELSQEVWAKAVDESAIMQLAQRGGKRLLPCGNVACR